MQPVLDNKPTNREQGAVALLVAMSLMLLAGFAALAVDGGMAYNERRTTQNAADNAALAGAWALCHDEDAVQAALDSAQSNGYTPPQMEAPQVDGDSVTVRIQSEVATGFGRTQGVSELGVNSEARARCVPGGGGGGILSEAALVSTGECGTVYLWNNMHVEGTLYAADDLTVAQNVELQGPVYTEGSLTVENNARIYGPVHSNADLTVINNSEHHHTSEATYVGSLTKKKHTSTWNPQKVPAREPLIVEPPYKASDYAPGSPAATAANAIGEYHHYSGDLDLQNNVVLNPGIYYVEGDVSLKNNVFGDRITIFAEGRIVIGNNVEFSSPYVENLVLMSTFGGSSCSTPAAIDVHNNSKVAGTVLAPYGTVDMGNNGALPGAVIGMHVELKNNFTILGDDQAWGGGDPEVLLEG